MSQCEIQAKVEGARELRTIMNRRRLLPVRHRDRCRALAVVMLESDQLCEQALSCLSGALENNALVGYVYGARVDRRPHRSTLDNVAACCSYLVANRPAANPSNR